MRTEAKLGVVLGAVLVIGASWYFFQRQTDTPLEFVPDAPPSELASRTGEPAPQSTNDESGSREREPEVAPVPSAKSPATPDSRPALTVLPVKDPAMPVAPAAEDADPASPRTESELTDPLAPVDLRGNETVRANRRLVLPDTPTAPAESGIPIPSVELARSDTSDPEPTPVPAPVPEAPAAGEDLDLRTPRTLIGATTPKPEAAKAPTTRPAPTPTTSKRRGASPTFAEHVIKSGDSLAILSETHYGSQGYVGALLAANPQIKNPNKIFVGTKIRIPPKSSVVGRAAAPGAASTPGRRGASGRSGTVPPVASGMYRVKSGETLYGLAGRHYGSGERWRSLLKLNRDLVDGDGRNLRAGQLIRLPAVLPDGAEAKAASARSRRR